MSEAGSDADDNRYGPDDSPDTFAETSETITAQDGEVEAEVIVRTSAPEVQPAAVLCDALATANRSIVDRVFSGDGMEAPQRAQPGSSVEDVTGEDDEGSGRLMDRDGGS